jgi:hypothetical protein
MPEPKIMKRKVVEYGVDERQLNQDLPTATIEETPVVSASASKSDSAIEEANHHVPYIPED